MLISPASLFQTYRERQFMTPEMAFECLFVSHDPAVFWAMDPLLQDLSIHTNVCSTSSRAANLLAEGSTDLVVIDLEDQDSSELMGKIRELSMRQKPTILALSAEDCAVPGVHVVLRKPVTPESGTKSLKAAYSKMLQDYRKHTRFAVMTPVLATDEDNRALSVTVTNIGDGGVGLTSKSNLSIGTTLSFRLPLAGLRTQVKIEARVLWTRQYGVAGCEFVSIAPDDLRVMRAWLESRYRFKKPSIPV
jgi:glutaredoxin